MKAHAVTALLVVCAACFGTKPQHIAGTNRSRLRNLKVGMTRAQVVEVMGDEQWDDVKGGFDVMSNPYETASYSSGHGDPIEVLYYYTTFHRWSGTAPKPKHLTPVVLTNGVLVGWGHEFLKGYEVRGTQLRRK